MKIDRDSIIAELHEAIGVAREQGERDTILMANDALSALGANLVEPISVAESKTALYRHYDKRGRLLYVGISLHTAVRLMGHKSQRATWLYQVARIDIEWLPTRKAALAAERLAIKTEKPPHNIQHNDMASLAKGFARLNAKAKP